MKYPRCAACSLEVPTKAPHNCQRCGEDAIVVTAKEHAEYDTARLADEGKR